MRVNEGEGRREGGGKKNTYTTVISRVFTGASLYVIYSYTNTHYNRTSRNLLPRIHVPPLYMCINVVKDNDNAKFKCTNARIVQIQFLKSDTVTYYAITCRHILDDPNLVTMVLGIQRDEPGLIK